MKLVIVLLSVVKQSIVCFAFSQSSLSDLKKQLNRYSGPILKYFMDIQGAERSAFVSSQVVISHAKPVLWHL